MANQMIALQTRNPQLPDPAKLTAQYASMMNMAQQNETAKRQAAQAQQAMTLAQRKDLREEALQGPALTKAELDNIRAQIDDLEEQYKMVSTEEGHQFWLNRVRKVDAAIADQIGMYVPNFDPEKVNNIMLTAKQAVDKIDPDAKATIEYAGKGGVDEQGNPIPEGTAIQVITGSKPSTRVIRNAPNASSPAPAAAPQAAPPSGPVPTGKFGETRVIRPESIPLTPDQQDHIRRMQEELGMTNTPASFTRGGTNTPTASRMSPDMVPAILDSAVQTGVMAQIDLDQMLALAPPQARQGIMDVIRSNKIALQADAPSLAASGMGQQQPPMAPNPVQRPDAGFAVYRGGQPPQSQTAALGGDMSMMRNTEAQYQPLQRRDPNQPIAPASSVVPLSRLGAEKTTETQAAENVRLKMAPAIATATRKAERAVELKSEATKAKYAAEGILNDVVDRINTIDELLRNPNRFSIIGPVEGNLPRIMQFGARADAQAAFDKIKNTATLTSLIDMRKSTETGASPVGANPTDKDAKIVEQAASKLIQTGEPSKFDAELIDMRRKLYRTYLSAQREHEGVYADVLKENPNLRLAVPKVSDRYLSTKDMPKKKTPVKTPTSRLSAETRAKYGL